MRRKLRSGLARRTLSVILAVVMILAGTVYVPQLSDGNGWNAGIVEAQAATVKLNYSSCKLDKGQRVNLYVQGTTSSVRWSTSNSSVAVVDSYGCVTGKNRGTAYVTAKLGNGKIYRCKISVSSRIHIRRSGKVLSDGKLIYIRQRYDSNWNYVNILYAYNPVTNKKKKLTSLKCMSLDDIKGNYIYFTAKRSSSSSTEYVYRISKDGRSQKCLAKGSNAKIVGNFIYYVYCGAVYRVKLDGSGKTFICNGSYELCVANNKLVGIKYGAGYYGFTQDTYLIGSKGRTKQISISSSSSVSKWTSPYDSKENFMNVSNNPYGYSYTSNGYESRLIKKVGGKSKVVRTFAFRIYDIYDVGEYVIVAGCNESVVKLAIVSKTGNVARTLHSRPATHQYIP